MSVEASIRHRLAPLEPVTLELLDESAKHQGHAGWKPGGNTHWRLTIVSEAFRGKSTLARHRMVYQALGDAMQTDIHALSIRSLTPDEC